MPIQGYVKIRQVVAGPGRRQWITSCDHPECMGRTLSCDLFHHLAVDVARSHQSDHDAKDRPAGVNVTGPSPADGNPRTMAASATPRAETDQRPPATRNLDQGSLNCGDWLAALLTEHDGIVAASTAIIDAGNHGFSVSAVARARQRLGVRTVKDGMRGGWAWVAPLTEEAEETNSLTKVGTSR